MRALENICPDEYRDRVEHGWYDYYTEMNNYIFHDVIDAVNILEETRDMIPLMDPDLQEKYKERFEDEYDVALRKTHERLRAVKEYDMIDKFRYEDKAIDLLFEVDAAFDEEQCAWKRLTYLQNTIRELADEHQAIKAIYATAER